jgi:hypothetical protein
MTVVMRRDTLKRNNGCSRRERGTADNCQGIEKPVTPTLSDLWFRRRWRAIQMVTRTLGSTTNPACQQHDNQHQENEPAKTSPHHRATDVKTTAAEQQQKNDQQNY